MHVVNNYQSNNKSSELYGFSQHASESTQLTNYGGEGGGWYPWQVCMHAYGSGHDYEYLY